MYHRVFRLSSGSIVAEGNEMTCECSCSSGKRSWSTGQVVYSLQPRTGQPSTLLAQRKPTYIFVFGGCILTYAICHKGLRSCSQMFSSHRAKRPEFAWSRRKATPPASSLLSHGWQEKEVYESFTLGRDIISCLKLYQPAHVAALFFSFLPIVAKQVPYAVGQFTVRSNVSQPARAT